jgi:uncharacterized spore protein YtfJ
MSAQDEIRTTVDELLRVLSMKNVIGEPIDMGDRTFITVARVGLAFGAAKGEAKGENGGGGGGGAGGAAGVSPIAAIVVYKNIPGPEGVKVLPLSPPSPLARAIGEIATVVSEKMGQRMGASKETPKEPAKEAAKAPKTS